MSDREKNRLATAHPPAPAAAFKPLSHRFKFLPHYIPPEVLDEGRFHDSAKLLVDWFLALVLGIVFLPVIIVTAIVVKLTSKGPAFYTQIRVGRGGRPYLLYKVRTMIDKSEQLTGPVWSVPGDKRITKVGKFLRSTHLDELPQLLNVLRGEMSLVGPRPERPEIIPSLEEQIPGYAQRLAVRPGVTGLAQVQLPADTDIDSVRRKLSYDLYYVRQRNLWLDLRLIVCTALKVVGMSFRMQRRLFALPHPEQVEKVSRLPLEVPAQG